MDKSLKVAIPFVALTGVVPLSVPPLGLFPILIPTFAELCVKFPNVSCISTVTLGEIVCPAMVFVG